ncbi:MAG: histidine kinase [Flavobacteriales bacterium]|nr:histidine kinase [Flavobacteriales bacterium]
MSRDQQRNGIRVPRKALYWGAQLVGWGAYFGLSVLASYLEGEYHPRMWDILLPEYLTGIGVSHALRAVILHRRWLEQGIGHVLPRVILASLIISVPALLLEGVLVGTALNDPLSMLARGPLDQVGRLINWTLLLTGWCFLYFAYGYFVRHRREEIRNLRLETASRENQLSTLRAQLNPHFMFNALNGIRALIDEDPAQAKRAITQLSAILRNAMSTVRRRTVPLGEELDIVKSYLALEAMRYEERLRVRFEVEDGLDREPVPPMLLQTLVENAVRHGVANLPQGGELVIGAKRRAEGLVLTVSNSGHYEPGKINGTGIGLRNTRKRLDLIYGDKAALRINNRDGMVVTEVDIPAQVERLRS